MANPSSESCYYPRNQLRSSVSGKTYRRSVALFPWLHSQSLSFVLLSIKSSQMIRLPDILILLSPILAEDNMNVQLKDITVTARDGRVSHLDQVYIRGSHVRFFIVPDMLRNAPMFRARGVKGRGVGMARGRATVNRARGQRGPRGG